MLVGNTTEFFTAPVSGSIAAITFVPLVRGPNVEYMSPRFVSKHETVYLGARKEEQKSWRAPRRASAETLHRVAGAPALCRAIHTEQS